MFTVDFASDFSGLSEEQIRNLEKKGILTPERHRGAKYYIYSDIYVLRMYRILKRYGLTHLKINNAFEYLRSWDPQKPLSSFVLLHNNIEIFTVMDLPHLISASRYGQLILEGIIEPKSVGSELEITQKAIRRYVDNLRELAKPTKKRGKVYSIDDLKQLLA